MGDRKTNRRRKYSQSFNYEIVVVVVNYPANLEGVSFGLLNEAWKMSASVTCIGRPGSSRAEWECPALFQRIENNKTVCVQFLKDSFHRDRN